MRILVLNPSPNELKYSLVEVPDAVCFEEAIKNWQVENIIKLLKKIKAEICGKIDAVAIRTAMGGTEFKGSVIVNNETKEKIAKLFPQAPMHLPMVLNLINAAQQTIKNVPIALVFDSAFFASLPNREALYGIDGSLSNKLNIRRFGYNGLFHKAAAEEMGGRSKIVSICLEPRPETTAIMYGQAIMVSSGATPIEGIPGQKSCGDIDGSIILALAEKKGLSPEQINIELTENSGIKGLAGKFMTINDVFESKDAKIKSIADIIFYRILMTCGNAIAAMGGVDTIIVSGRYAKDAGKVVIEKLKTKLENFISKNKKVKWEIFDKPLNEIIAEEAVIAVLKNN